MQSTIDKILVVINECKDPIKDTKARLVRDDALTILAKEFSHMDRDEFEDLGRNQDERDALSWFYTRFIQFKKVAAHGEIRKEK